MRLGGIRRGDLYLKQGHLKGVRCAEPKAASCQQGNSCRRSRWIAADGLSGSQHRATLSRDEVSCEPISRFTSWLNPRPSRSTYAPSMACFIMRWTALVWMTASLLIAWSTPTSSTATIFHHQSCKHFFSNKNYSSFPSCRYVKFLTTQFLVSLCF